MFVGLIVQIELYF